MAAPGAAAVADRAQARELVDEIAVNHGYLPPHVVDLIPDEIRAVVLHALQKKDNMIAASVSTLAQNLYSSSARFIFELLQNAADNSYLKALAAGHDPYVSFSVYPDRIVVECNEDGFTKENLTATCNIGKSSKQGAQGYIGEKGIGFKSTFMAAWKVQIESGPFTFYFEHRMGDSGMGMITPIWFEPEDEFSGPGTRISLYFHDNGTPGNLTKRRDEVIKQLKELQGESLLFVNKLRGINIAVFESDEHKIWSKSMKLSDSLNFAQVSELRTSEFDDASGVDSETVRKFHVTKHLATGLAKNENRSYSETEEGLALYSTSQVILAFPLDQHDEPIIEIQDVYAFMPVRKVGFNFLIHADFVTQANRQDIVWSSRRNIGLRKAIGQALIKGIEELAKHRTLCYKWMRYLPRESSLKHSPFWNDMISEIKSPLAQARIIVPIRQGARCPMHQMRRLEARHLDKNGKPLISDPWSCPMYLSQDYEEKDLDNLTEYGLQMLQLSEIYAILFVMVNDQSWKKALFESRDEDWHSRLAKLILAAMDHDTTKGSGSSQLSSNLGLSIPSTGLFSFGSSETANAQSKGNLNSGTLFSFNSQDKVTKANATNGFDSTASTPGMFSFDDKNIDSTKSSVRSNFAHLALIPLASGEVVPSIPIIGNGTTCYFPDIEGIPVPRDLEPRVILPAAAANSACRQLYESLGAVKPSPAYIMKKLVARYKTPGEHKVTLEESKQHLVWLYQMKLPSSGPDAKFHPLFEKNPSILEDMILFDHNNRRMLPQQELGYVPAEGKYSALNWLRPVQIPGEPDVGLRVSFLHQQYFEDPPHQPLGSGWDWAYWLSRTLKLPRRVEFIIISDDPRDAEGTLILSVEAAFLIKYRSEEVLTYFASGWRTDFKRYYEKDSKRAIPIRKSKFRTTSEDKICVLEEAFLPFPALLSRCERFLRNPKAINFLKVEAPLEDDDPDWMGFGKHFGVNVNDDIHLSLTILRALISGASAPADSMRHSIWKLYNRIYAQYLALDEKERHHVQWKFRSYKKTIYIGDNKDGISLWRNPNDCAWDAPPGFSRRIPLRENWKEVLDSIEPQESDSLTHFFCHFLEIGNTNVQDIMDELCLKRDYPPYNRHTTSNDLKETYELLSQLSATNATHKTLNHIRHMFSHGKMIYIPTGKNNRYWFKSSECLWSANGAVVRKPCLKEFYPDLEDFFHQFLKIPELDLKLFYQELVDMHDTVPTAAAAKDMLVSLNAMLSSTANPMRFDPQAERFHIFPAILPNGTRKVLRSRDHFLIGDRRHYVEALKDSLTILDLTLDEVAQLHVVFKWFGLKDRYLSQAVIETTAVKQGHYEKFNSLARDLALKAPALVSIAIYFHRGLDPHQLNARLQRVQVYATDSIVSTLKFEYLGNNVEKSIGKSDFHIKYVANNDIEIYTTADEDSRDLAFASKLPRELMAVLMNYLYPRDVDDAAVNIVASILQAKQSHVQRILELNGVPDLKLPRLVSEDYLAAEVEAEKEKMANLPESVGRSSQSWLAPQVTYDTGAYLDVLVRVVEAARAHQFPTKSGEADLPYALNGLNISDSKPKPKSLRFFHPDTDEWRLMVGAVGELFVFEMLSSINPPLPKFGRSNWQSVIRKYVTAHPDYTNMDAWVGEEEGDIQYKDSQNALTDYLIAKGYFDETWVGECPEYHIEVKTSIGSLGTPFHMSKSQYNRMRRYWSEASTGSSRKKVFAIFRVYGLEPGEIGVKVYVDAESASQEGNLKFEADSWVVRAL
ncbi:unnamed protein product [Clonostachys rosea]|uniref:Protein NO VEIN C-terminal domain-containing protein n=1 Tax=Bionectria ochroleuca TaxID=29856 RepID=A0ABY6UJB8_BIOOC|nr:unnamed protein product [Clonostachys rosea]